MRPWAHQARALEKMSGQEAFALRMHMRTGKSKVILDDYGGLEAAGACQDLLVIAPGGCYRTWQKAIADHLGDDLVGRVLVHVWISSDRTKATRKARDQFMRAELPRILIMNVEALSTVESARETALNFLKRRRAMCVIDESTCIRGPDAERTKFVIGELRKHAEYRRILSGLMTPRSPIDLWPQFYFLDPNILGHWSLTTFKARYADVYNACLTPSAQLYAKLRGLMERDPRPRTPALVDKSRTLLLRTPRDVVAEATRDEVIAELRARRVYVQSIEMIKGYKNEAELHGLIEPHSHLVRLDECYELPPKMYAVREVEMTRDQRRVYEELVKYATAELADQAYVTATHVLARATRLRQVLCGHTIDEQGVEHAIPEGRTDRLLELLDEHEGKGVVWCSYDYDVRKVAAAIEARCGEGSVARFWGGNTKTREDEERRYLNDPDCRYMVATTAAGMFGRPWNNADLVVYYSNDYDLEHRMQSEERAQAVGKTVSVQYVDLITPGTIDEKIIYALRDKIDMAAALAGEAWRQWLV